MSNSNVPPGTGERRLRVSRLLTVLFALAVAVTLAYFLLGNGPTAPPSQSEAPKDVAALFESIQGNVKTRGVGGLEWRTAEIEAPLRKSDLVRTYPSSSAEIKFFDDTRVTVRPDSLITIEETSRDPNSTSSKVAWKVSSGEINYETARRGGGSTEAVTPTFRLAVDENSAGTMRVGESGLTAVAQISGAANIETKTGEKIRLGPNEGLRVDATGKAGTKQVLPEVPAALAPDSGAGGLAFTEGTPVVLSWSPSTGSAAYRVQVETKTTGGLELVHDRDGIKGNSATIPGLTVGEFSYKVAGLTADGVQGRFSAPVSFRVDRAVAAPVVASANPAPMLMIESLEARDNVIRLTGKTEPGARLTVNGDPVTVQPDGSFREFVTLVRKPGEQRVVIRSTSLAGGVAEETRTLPSGR